MAGNGKCPNSDMIKEMCPCTETDCSSWAHCCGCVDNHWGNSQWPKTACARSAKRTSAKAEVDAAAIKAECPNYQRNLDMCPCTNESCDYRGLCCLCVNNHYGDAEYPLTACMRGIARPATA